jgi:hypothetical protein
LGLADDYSTSITTVLASEVSSQAGNPLLAFSLDLVPLQEDYWIIITYFLSFNQEKESP